MDLLYAYLQLQLDELSQEHVTINTHRGPYHYTCLPFGVYLVPAIFQCTMETLLKGLSMVVAYLYDILVAVVAESSSSTGISRLCWKLKKEKCVLCLPQVEYLGHIIISAEGLCPAASKVKAIKEAPKPSSQSKLKFFLGLVNYYAKFCQAQQPSLPHSINY